MNTTTTETSTSRVPASVPAAAPAPSATWDIDTAHASAGFRVRHLMVSHVRGHLGPVTGTVSIDEQDLSRSDLDQELELLYQPIVCCGTGELVGGEALMRQRSDVRLLCYLLEI